MRAKQIVKNKSDKELKTLANMLHQYVNVALQFRKVLNKLD